MTGFFQDEQQDVLSRFLAGLVNPAINPVNPVYAALFCSQTELPTPAYGLGGGLLH